MKQDGIGRDTNHKRLLIMQNKLRVVEGRGGKESGGWVMDIGEGMCYGEC